ncbi:MAG: DUF3560 domain-containing protein [Verrucomicrobiae bacterium]|nr:DUF3560 domain-containing protein [Verrucomicrobiae bacterium]
MNAYEIKQAARAGRYRTLAQKAHQESDAAYQSYKNIADQIPFGQPILVGHHSEARHRRDIDRMDSAMSRSVQEEKKAKYYERKAATIQNNLDTGRVVSSDDPEAIQKLKARIDDTQAESIRSKLSTIANILKETVFGKSSVPKLKKAKATKRKGKRSAAVRAKMAASQRKRWAKLKGQAGKKSLDPKKRHTMSPEGRARVAAAQKKRWAAQKSGSKEKTTSPKKTKRTMSPEGRARVATAQRARWAKVKKEKAKGKKGRPTAQNPF